MTIKFQRKVMRFLCRPENKRYVELLDPECFDTVELKLCFEVLRSYVKEFSAVPDATSAVEYLHRTPGYKTLRPDTQKDTDAYLETLFTRRDEDTGLVIKTIIDYASTKRTSELMKKSISKMKEGEIGDVKRFHAELGKIAHLDDKILELESGRGGFLLKDHNRNVDEVQPGIPCFLTGVNKLTAAGGFKTPELVIILAAPKGFKTGLSLSMGVNYMKDGLNVYYADFENGHRSIKTRAKQVLMNCTRKELGSSDNIRRIQRVMRQVSKFGGDMVVDKFDAYSTTVADVEQVLAEYHEQYNWRPDVIVWDYPDLIKPNAPQKEERMNITRVYFDIINLNSRLGCFSIGVSQVNRAAVSKDVLTITDFAADFGKAMNCHAAFALCRTPAEVEAGIGRIVPVAQREGVRYKSKNVCFVKIDEERMSIEQIDEIQAKRLLEGIVLPKTTAGKSGRPVRKKPVTDD